ncbi:MAG: YggT family protein [Burkholderiaceae bacterium]|jgi:YggT family protein|nr:YggT family protein [Burkholderiaceae bacterium]MDH5207256.1 YggT family protein [Burkholderiaceae bacterium]
MLADIARFLLDILGSLLVALLLLRAWMRYIGMPSRNPVAMFTFAMTNWLVGPVSRVLPSRGRIDWASILSALVVTLLLVLLMRAVVGVAIPWDFALLAALRQLVIWGLNVIVWVTIIYVVIGWVNPHAPFAPAFEMLLHPLLKPIRRAVPTVGGFDLSPMVLLIGVYVLQMVVARL